MVRDGAAVARVTHDGSPAAARAADLLRSHVTLITGAALPEQGEGPALLLSTTEFRGYQIVAGESGASIAGDDPILAVCDLLEGWGCRLGGPAPEVTRLSASLEVEARTWRRERDLWLEDCPEDFSWPAQGLSVRGLAEGDPARLPGRRVRVASETFDDFLPVSRYEAHPEWFAMRQGGREARGNFCTSNEAAREAWLAAAGAWLEAHPGVACLGIWPEVTQVWCECPACAPLSVPERYALLWRAAAARFPERRLEILATEATLRPPPGEVPPNIEVRLRPGRQGCGLHGIADERCPHNLAPVLAAWEARGASPLLEIDAAPDSWCGMPWPCQQAVRENARRIRAAVLRRGTREDALLWRDPSREPSPALVPLLQRAASLHSWGDPGDCVDLLGDQPGLPIVETERRYRAAMDPAAPIEVRRANAAEALFFHKRVVRTGITPEALRNYRLYRGPAFLRMAEELLPGGAERKVAGATIREFFDRVEVETDRVKLAIDDRTAVVTSARRRLSSDWGADLSGGDGVLFSVVSTSHHTERCEGAVRIDAGKTPGVQIEIGLEGRLSRGGPRWASTLRLLSGSPVIEQAASVEEVTGVAAGCQWNGPLFDHWVCPAHAAEGPLRGVESRRAIWLPAGTLVYCRAGEEGPGLACRLPQGGQVALSDGPKPSLVAVGGGRILRVDWILMSDSADLG